tara:strand:+ start:255 stop:1340 length:1086 start_codon:yes stop_codon:yes gene_type:complete
MSELEEKKKRKKAGSESSKESSLRDWFKRKGAKGKKGGWVDCNAPDGKGGYKSCGRSSGEKRKKYPACRPTPGACKERGRGKSWGKKGSKKKRKESMELSRDQLKKIILEELDAVLSEKEGKKDACYHKVKARYDVWPSAYASGALSKCRKVGAANWGNKSKKNENLDENAPTKGVYSVKPEDIKKAETIMNLYAKNDMKEKAAKIQKVITLGKSHEITIQEFQKMLKSAIGMNEEVSEEEMTDAEKKQLRKITGQLKNSAKMHKDQAEDIEGMINEDQIEEAEYRGRKVTLNKPMRGDVKKFKVFVKDPKTGNVKKVNFGDPNMRIKKSNPKRRKSFRARHNCDNPGPKTKARYWSCKKW